MFLQVVTYMQLNDRATAAGLWTIDPSSVPAAACAVQLYGTISDLLSTMGDLLCSTAAPPLQPAQIVHAVKSCICIAHASTPVACIVHTLDLFSRLILDSHTSPEFELPIHTRWKLHHA